MTDWSIYLLTSIMGWATKVQFLAGTETLSLHHHAQTSSGAYPASTL